MMNVSGLGHETYFEDYVEDELDWIRVCVCFCVTGGVLRRTIIVIAF